MLIILFDLAKLSFSLALEGQPKSGYPGTSRVYRTDRISLTICEFRTTKVTFYNPRLSMMPSTCSI